MSIRTVKLAGGEFFHIYNRGNSKQEIFLDDEDRDRFIKLLYLCNSEKRFNFREDIVKKHIDVWDYERGSTIVAIGAWVLMPNHFHLYISSMIKEDDKNEKLISIFINKLCTGYSMYFNKKYNRTGKLFENKFKSVHISEEVQAKYLFSYIHLNPVKLIQKDWKEVGIKDKQKALTFLESYKSSSYLEYLGIERKENKILNKENFLSYYKTTKDFKKEIFQWLALGNS
jgi:putative transposase